MKILNAINFQNFKFLKNKKKNYQKKDYLI